MTTLLVRLIAPGCLVAGALVLNACSGSVSYLDDAQNNVADGAAWQDGGSRPLADSGRYWDGGSFEDVHDAKVVDAKTHDSHFIDPGCPDAPAPVVEKDCDPLAPAPGGCADGEACYPYVVYPDSSCGAEQYGAICIWAGSGTQGDPCDGEMCSAGFVCVVSGAGNQCVKLCALDKIGACTDGLVCEPLDVPGYGGCL